MTTKDKRKLDPTYGRTGKGQGWSKGKPDPRNHAGESNSHAKLTDDDVVSIRLMYATGDWRQWELGELYGIKQAAVSSVVHGRNWPHIH